MRGVRSQTHSWQHGDKKLHKQVSLKYARTNPTTRPSTGQPNRHSTRERKTAALSRSFHAAAPFSIDAGGAGVGGGRR